MASKHTRNIHGVAAAYGAVIIVTILVLVLYWMNEAQRREQISREIVDSETRFFERERLELESAIDRNLDEIESVATLIESEPSDKIIRTLLESLLLDSDIVFQARLIAPTGWERYRIERVNGTRTWANDSALQDKSDRPYFRDSISLEAGRFYVSTIDLNVENGQIEKPYRPTVRLARKLANNLGVVVVNLDLSGLIEESTRSYSAGVDTWIVNAQGDWLVGPSPDLEWGFLLGERKTLAEYYTAEVSRKVLGSHQLASIHQFPDDALLIALHVNPGERTNRTDRKERIASVSAPVLVRQFSPAYMRSTFARYESISPTNVTLGVIGFALLLMTLISRIRARASVEQRFRDLARDSEVMRDVANFLPQMAYTCDAKGGFTFLSQRWGEFLGVPLERLMQGIDDFVHPDDRMGLGLNWDAAILSGRPYKGSFRLRRYDGLYRTVETSLLPFKDDNGDISQWFGSTTDIQDSVDIQEALAHENQLLGKMLDNSSEQNERLLQRLEIALEAGRIGTWEHDVASNTVEWDTRLYQLYGIEPREGPQPYDLIKPYVSDQHWQKLVSVDMRTLGPGEPFSVEFEITRPSGDTRWLSGAAYPVFNDAGELVKVVGCNVDITEVKSNELAAREARARAESANRSKAAFLANMSHEIRTPMNGVLGMLSLLRDDARDEMQHADLTKAYRSAERLLTILNDILDLSRFDSGNFSLAPARFALEELISTSVELFAVTAEQKGLRLQVDVDPDIPNEMIGDMVRIGQIISNIVGNAVKFTPEGGDVRVQFHSTFLPDSKLRLTVTVSDTGIGLNPEDQERIFQSFEQADNTTSRRYGGTGLGLSISRRLAQLMRGDIKVSSSPGEGAEFVINLEVTAIDDAPAFSEFNPLSVQLMVYTHDKKLLEMVELHVGHWGGSVGQYKDLESLTSSVGEVVNAEHCAVLIDLCSNGVVTADALTEFIDGLVASLGARHVIVYAPAAASRTATVTALDLSRRDVQVIRLPMTPSRLYNALTRLSLLVAEDRPIREQVSELVGLKVLCVDDVEINTEVASRMLSASGFEVDCVSSGSEALQAVEHRDYDLILMDVHMDGMNGLEAVRRIRAMPELRQPIIFGLSASVMPEDRQAGLESGMDDYLTKPFRMQDMLVALALRGGVEPMVPAIESVPPAECSGGFPEFIDLNDAMDRLDNQHDLLVAGIRSFVIMSPSLRADYVDAITQSRHEEAGKLMHRLKGAALVIADLKLGHIAADWEKRHADGEVGDGRAVLEVLDQHCSELEAFLMRGDGAEPISGFDKDLFEATLADVCERLARNNIPGKESCKTVADGLRQIGQSGNAVEFERAMSVLDLGAALNSIRPA